MMAFLFSRKSLCWYKIITGSFEPCNWRLAVPEPHFRYHLGQLSMWLYGSFKNFLRIWKITVLSKKELSKYVLALKWYNEWLVLGFICNQKHGAPSIPCTLYLARTQKLAISRKVCWPWNNTITKCLVIFSCQVLIWDWKTFRVRNVVALHQQVFPQLH